MAASATLMPRMMYGTAWKKDATRDLVYLALKMGFTGIDTACQPRHYNEADVGAGIQLALEEGIISRDRLFIQTKYSPLSCQDASSTPYDRTAPIADQVAKSVEVSKVNLGATWIDQLVLHEPFDRLEDTLAAWSAMEAAVQRGDVRALGISNVYELKTLQAVYDAAVVKPSVVQNRFVRDFGYSRDIRDFCSQRGIKFQSFWTLSGNPKVLGAKPFLAALDSLKAKGAVPQEATREQVFFRFVMDMGITPLSGTTSERHMVQDLDVLNWQPLPAEERTVMAKLLE